MPGNVHHHCWFLMRLINVNLQCQSFSMWINTDHQCLSSMLVNAYHLCSTIMFNIAGNQFWLVLILNVDQFCSSMLINAEYYPGSVKGSDWIRLVFAHPFPLNSRTPIASANFIAHRKVYGYIWGLLRSAVGMTHSLRSDLWWTTQKSTTPILALKLSVSAIITPGGLPQGCYQGSPAG